MTRSLLRMVTHECLQYQLKSPYFLGRYTELALAGRTPILSPHTFRVATKSSPSQGGPPDLYLIQLARVSTRHRSSVHLGDTKRRDGWNSAFLCWSVYVGEARRISANSLPAKIPGRASTNSPPAKLPERILQNRFQQNSPGAFLQTRSEQKMSHARVQTHALPQTHSQQNSPDAFLQNRWLSHFVCVTKQDRTETWIQVSYNAC